MLTFSKKLISKDKISYPTYNVRNEETLENLKIEEDLFSRYFLWEAMVEERQFTDPLEEFICLLDLVFQGSEVNICRFFNKGVLQNDENSSKTIDIIRIGYPRKVIIQKMREWKQGKLFSLPKRENFVPYEKALKSSYEAVDLLRSISDEIQKMPAAELFDRLGAWMNACKNSVFRSELEEIIWFIKYVLQEDDKNLKKIYEIKPTIKYSELFMKRKLDQFLEENEITISENDLNNINDLSANSDEKDLVKRDPLEDPEIDILAEKLGIDNKVLKNLQDLGLSVKLSNNNEDLTIPVLKQKSTFSICVKKDTDIIPEKEISYFHKVVFIPLQKDGFFLNKKKANDFFVYKMCEILDLSKKEVVQKAESIGIFLEMPQQEQVNYSEYFVDDKNYKMYQRFREADFTSERYKIVESSPTVLYFLNMNHGFKQQKDLSFELRSNAEVAKFNTLSVVNDRKESDKLYDFTATIPCKIGQFSCFMVENDENIQGIGQVEITSLDEIIHEYNLAYLVKIEHQGKLLGYCIAKAMIDYARSLVERQKIESPLRIIAIVHRDNMASISLLKKLGFQQIIGKNKEKEFYIRGMVSLKFSLEI